MSQRSDSPRGGPNGTARPNFPAEPPALPSEPRFPFPRPDGRALTPPAPAAAPLPPGPAVPRCPRDPPRPRSCGTHRLPCLPSLLPVSRLLAALRSRRCRSPGGARASVAAPVTRWRRGAPGGAAPTSAGRQTSGPAPLPPMPAAPGALPVRCSPWRSILEPGRARSPGGGGAQSLGRGGGER